MGFGWKERRGEKLNDRRKQEWIEGDEGEAGAKEEGESGEENRERRGLAGEMEEETDGGRKRKEENRRCEEGRRGGEKSLRPSVRLNVSICMVVSVLSFSPSRLLCIWVSLSLSLCVWMYLYICPVLSPSTQVRMKGDLLARFPSKYEEKGKTKEEWSRGKSEGRKERAPVEKGKRRSGKRSGCRSSQKRKEAEEYLERKRRALSSRQSVGVQIIR